MRRFFYWSASHTMKQPQSNVSARYKHIDLAPTNDMKREAIQGLEWWRKHEGRGGNEMALARAWRIRQKAPLSPDVVRRMAAHMGKLEERKQHPGWNFGEYGYPSDSRITWALMGGDAGFAWARSVVEQLDAADAGLTANVCVGSLAANEVTQQEVGGKTYVVAPVVALVPGVVNGFLVTEETLLESVRAWEGRPVTLRHPKVGNQYVTANDPAIAARQQLGIFFNVEYSGGRLRGQIWLDPEMCQRVGAEAVTVLEALQGGQTYEVSTGYFCQVEGDGGTWEGTPYEGEQVNLEPDHLAVLPDEIGACSWADGCGTPRVNVVRDLSGNGRHLIVNTLANNAQDYSNSAMVAFFLRDQAVRYSSHISQWPEGAEPTPLEEYHVTLAYLGEIDSFPPGIDYNTVAKTVAEFARYQPAMHSTVSGMGRFGVPAGFEDVGAIEPVYLSIDSADLQTMRAELVAFLEATGIPVRREHGFTPHITLGYVPSDSRMELSAPAPSQLAVDAIALAWGNNVTAFPLLGEAYSPQLAEPAANSCSCKEIQAMSDETVIQEGQAKEGVTELIAKVEIEPSEADQLVAEFGGTDAVRAMLQQFQANVRAEQNGLIAKIAANSRNAFSEGELHSMPVDTLRKLEQSLRPADYSVKPAANSAQDSVTFYGQAWKPYQAPVIK